MRRLRDYPVGVRKNSRRTVSLIRARTFSAASIGQVDIRIVYSLAALLILRELWVLLAIQKS
jgi:hypothetical protein